MAPSLESARAASGKIWQRNNLASTTAQTGLQLRSTKGASALEMQWVLMRSARRASFLPKHVSMVIDLTGADLAKLVTDLFAFIV